MDYSILEQSSYSDLKKMAKDMDLPVKKSRSEYVTEIQRAFDEYESYKSKKIHREKHNC